MRKYRKTAGVLALVLSLPGILTAEDKKAGFKKPPLSKEAIEQEETWERHRMGHLAFYVRPYLREEERKKVSDLVRMGLERSIAVEAKKYAESLPTSARDEKRPNPQYILGHLWFSAEPHLLREERAIIHKFIDQGFARKYQEPLSKWTRTGGNKKPLKIDRPAVSVKSEEEVREEVKETLGHLWISVRPFLREEENKALSDAILKGFERHMQQSKRGSVLKATSSPSGI